MSNPNRIPLSALPMCVFLAILLASAGVLADSPTKADDADRQQASAPGAQTDAVESDQSVQRKKATLNSTRQQSPARVYLEDFDRVHRQVNRRYPTETYWVGKNPPSK